MADALAKDCVVCSVLCHATRIKRTYDPRWLHVKHYTWSWTCTQLTAYIPLNPQAHVPRKHLCTLVSWLRFSFCFHSKKSRKKVEEGGGKCFRCLLTQRHAQRSSSRHTATKPPVVPSNTPYCLLAVVVTLTDAIFTRMQWMFLILSDDRCGAKWRQIVGS